MNRRIVLVWILSSLVFRAVLLPACGDDRSDEDSITKTPNDAGQTDDSGQTGDSALDIPIGPPVPDDCITDVSAGDHEFSCGEVDFLVMVDERCTRFACGLIFDVHGGTMSGAQMRRNTELHELAPSKGYIVVNPSERNNFWTETHYPTVLDFMQRIIEAFHVDKNRVHITGFSLGGLMSWWFICNHGELFASAAPAAAAVSCITSEGIEPEIPILYMNGKKDEISYYEVAEPMRDRLIEALGMKNPRVLAGDDGWEHKRWTNDFDIDFDFVWHDYGGQAVLDGHCLPGGTDTEGIGALGALNAMTCTTGDINFHWGELVLQFFLDHPKR